jgi:putative restriction endonuclease
METNQKERAYRAWPILIKTAKDKGKITYSALGKQLDIHHRVVRFVLGEIQDYCLEEKLPPLTVLVVNQNTEMPGEGFIAWDIDDIETAITKVHHFNWSQKGNPFSFAFDGTTEDELINKLIDNPEQSEQVYSRIKARGPAQTIFRKALIEIYKKQCAFCGFSFPEALEAAHIITWSKATPAQRMEPSNGLLLCSIHHKLFDCGLISLNSSYEVIYDNSTTEKGDSKSDKIMTTGLHKQKAFLPKLQKHYPSLSYLEIRYRK